MSKQETIYAVSDIHGRLDLLNDLLAQIAADAADTDHRVLFIGDYIDRGPDSKGVIDRLIDFKRQRHTNAPVFLKGNHERRAYKALASWVFDRASFDSWIHYGGQQTLASYGVTSFISADSQLRKRFQNAVAANPGHKEFLKSLTLTFETATHFFCHAGVDFSKPLDRQDEVDLLHIGKRFFESARHAGKIIVHGHTITEDHMPAIRPNRIGIDTGAYQEGTGSDAWPGKLTACVLQPQAEPRFLFAT